jgi:acyl carrier protein
MTIEKFIQELQQEVFTETNIELLTPETCFKDLNEWDSLISLSLIAHFDMNLGKKISGEQIKSSSTFQDLFEIGFL